MRFQPGFRYGASTSLVLDGLTASAAYSTRKLRTAYSGSGLRVRRASDNAEQDIGFSLNLLDTSSLTTFCAATDGFVVTWYDQSGNARDLTQATAGDQPQIVSGGSLLNTVNSNGALNFDASQFMATTANVEVLIDEENGYTVFSSLRANAATATANYYEAGMYSCAVSGEWGGGPLDNPANAWAGGHWLSGDKVAKDAIGGFPITGIFLVRWDDTNIESWVDGGTPTQTASTGNIGSAAGTLQNIMYVGSNHLATPKLDGDVLELILFASALSSGQCNAIGNSLATYAGSSWSSI
jgi:hypothetical protein